MTLIKIIGLVCALTTCTHTYSNTTIKGIPFYTMAAFMLIARADFAESTLLKNIAYETDSNSTDLTNSCAFSLTLWGARYAFDSYKTKRWLAYLAICTPLATLLTTNSTWRSIINSIPLIRTHLGCMQSKCKGVCHSCKMKTAYQQGALSLILAYYLNYLPL